jgi:hypothetical protein
VLRRRRPGSSVLPLALIVIGSLLGLVLVAYLVGILDLIRASVGLAILVLPGFALAITCRPVTPLRRLDLFLAAAALSLACVAIGGLLLNLLPVGLGRLSWLGLVGALLLATAVLARSRLPSLPRETWVSPKPGQALAMVAAGVLVAVALAIARVGVHQPSEPFTALWVVPESPGTVEIGIDNREDAATTYRVEVTVDGRVTATFTSITVEPGQGWTTLMPEPDPAGSRMEVLVFVDSRPGVVYRRVTFSTASAAVNTGT